MTRAQQVRYAVKELGGAGRAEIEQALDAIADERVLYERAKESKGALDKIASAMHRAQQALGSLPVKIREELGYPPFDRYKAAAIKRRRGENRDRDHVKVIAAEEARRLLAKFGFPHTTTRGERWCRLAAVLYGDKNANLAWQCRKLKKGKKRASR